MVFVKTSILSCLYLFFFFSFLLILTLLYSNLSNNEFFATLIDCIGDMTSLTDLRLSNNTFQGLPPASLGNLSNLKKLCVYFPFIDLLEKLIFIF